MHRIFYIFILPAVILLSITASAQIVAPYADYADTASYTGVSGPDSLYFFNVDNDSVFIMVDTQNFPAYDAIQWEEYEQNVGYSNISGGEKIYVSPDDLTKSYRLTITVGGVPYVQTCWLILNDFNVEITSKDNGDTLWTSSYLYCDRLELIDVLLDTAHLEYYNPISFDTLYYSASYDSIWVQGIDEGYGEISVVRNIGDVIRHRITDPYWEDMYYTNTTTDFAGLERKDSMYVRSIVPKAEFTEEYIELSDEEFYPNRSDQYYNLYYSEGNYGSNVSAPAIWRFVSESINAHEYFWDFGDDTAILNTESDTAIHTYNYWGEFTTTLVAKHTFDLINMECYDTLELDEGTISIDEPQLRAPNAFSPPNGGTPYWRFADVTITDFEIKIYSRIGRKVHDFKGSIRDWNGWDGKFNNSDNYVSTGVYYYVVRNYSYLPNIDDELNEDVQWEGIEDNNQYRGFIHVFNTE